MTPDELLEVTRTITECRKNWVPVLEDSIGVTYGYRPHDTHCTRCKPMVALLAHIAEQDKLLVAAEGEHAELWAERNGLQVKVAEQERQLAEAREALQPFAEYAARCEGVNWLPDTCRIIVEPTGDGPTVGDCRRAAGVGREEATCACAYDWTDGTGICSSCKLPRREGAGE
jgi:hypothetical protein